MEISPIQLFRLLLVSLLFGAIMGAVSDLNRIARMMIGLEAPSKKMQGLYAKRIPVMGRSLSLPSVKRGRAVGAWTVTAVQDVVWFVLAGVGAVVIGYTFNDGRLRLYTLLGMVLGGLGYRLLIGSWAKYVLETATFLMRAVLGVLFFLILLPFRKIMAFLLKKIHYLLKSFHKALEKKRKKVYNLHGIDYFLQEARRGFLTKSKKEKGGNDAEKVF